MTERANEDRVARARQALTDYSDGDAATGMQDLLTDLHHLAAKEHLEIDELLSAARLQYEEETADEAVR